MSRLPIVTVLLIAANLIAAFVLLVQPGLVAELGFRSHAPDVGSALSSLFLHANVLHLLGNMLFLAVVGAAVEAATGSIRFAAVYLLSGVMGVAMHYVITKNHVDQSILIGASGSIAGCAGYYSVRYKGLRVSVTPMKSVSVATVTGVWLVLQVLGAFIRIGEGSGGVSYWAHLGGFAAGILSSYVFRAPDVGQVRLGHEVLAQMQERSPAAVAVAARQHLKLHPHDPVALRQLALALAKQNDVAGETAALVGLLDVVPEEDQPEILRRLCEIKRCEALPSIRRTMLAERLRELDGECAALVLRTVLNGDPDDPQRPEAMLALAGMEREREPERAARLLQELERSYPLHPTVDLAKKRGWL